jgi:hypothetical protein
MPHQDEVLKLCGWKKELAPKENAKFAHTLPQFKIMGANDDDWKGKRRMLWECTRKVLGKDTPNYRQEIGDCTSFGAKNVMEYLQCTRIVIDGQDETFKPIFPSYFYGCSRVYIGQGQLGSGDGSMGVWTQEAAKKYGVLSMDAENCPAYSGSTASKWGMAGPDKQFVPIAQKNLVQTTAKIMSKEELANGLYHGYPLAVCSNQGFSYGVDSQGFHQPQGNWGHCMTVIGYEDHPTLGLYFLILNSWGDMFGHLKDFTSGEDLPVGVIRTRGDVLDSMLQSDGGDSFVYSSFQGFPGNGEKLDEALFDVVGL